MKKLSIIISHPIQYNAPVFKLLTDRKKINLKVFYTWGEQVLANKYDPGFGKIVEWDIPLLEGYAYSFVRNVSKKPGSHHFNGINNPTLIEEIEAWKPDAVLVFGWNFRSHLAAIRHFHNRLPVYFRGDSTLLDEEKGIIKRTIRGVALRWLYRHVSKAFYVGEANKAYFKKFGLHESQLVFAPHAVDNDRFQKDGDDSLRQEIGIPREGIVFLFTGKFEQKKDPLLLIEAFLQLDDPNAYLLFAGAGKLEAELKRKAGESGELIKNRICFRGFQNQQAMPGVYKAGNVTVLSSRGPGETWGLSINEAMASNRAVIVSDKCGCHPDLVKEGINGYVFKAGDAGALAAKMKTMLGNRQKIDAMGEASGEIIAGWSFEHICFAIENVMESL